MKKSSRTLLKNTLIFVAAATMMTACSIDANNNNLTEADKVSAELEELIEDHDIARVSVYLLTDNQGYTYYRLENDKKYFELEEHFILVGGTYYNLENLDKYRKYLRSKPFYLELYFDVYR